MPGVAYTFIIIIVFAIGAVIGSFLNVLIYRLPRGLGYVKGFSFCPVCGHRLFPRDLVPIFSYLALRRKCRYCGAAIRPRYIGVELSAGLLAVLSWAAFMPPGAYLACVLARGRLDPPGADFTGATGFTGLTGFTGFTGATGFASNGILAAALYFAVLACLLAIAWIDHDTMEIPDSLNIAIAACGVAAIFAAPYIPLGERLIGIVVAAGPLFVIMLFVDGAFGGGDVKLDGGGRAFSRMETLPGRPLYRNIDWRRLWSLCPCGKEEGAKGAFCLRPRALRRHRHRDVRRGTPA